MIGRREFLRTLAMLGFGLGVGADSWAAALKGRHPAAPAKLYTRRVREITRALDIPRSRWTWIVAHHSAIREGNAANYDRAHRRRGMENGLAYHFVIGNGVDSGDGEIEIGPRWQRQLKGGHVKREDVNLVGIGICLVGNFQQTRPTPKQLAAFRELVDYLRADVTGRRVRFAVHKEVDRNHTVCPGRHFPVAEMHGRYG